MKLMVIGLDCAAPELVFSRWTDELPHLARLMDTGAHGPLESCHPPITVPAWSVTTLLSKRAACCTNRRNLALVPRSTHPPARPLPRRSWHGRCFVVLEIHQRLPCAAAPHWPPTHSKTTQTDHSDE